MQSNLPTLTYHAQQYRIRVELTRQHAVGDHAFVVEVIRRARAKMESLLKEGKIVNFDVFESKLNGIIDGLKTANSLPLDHKVSFTLAAGAPFLQGLKIDKLDRSQGLLGITLLPGSPLKAWNREWIKATIIKKSKDLGIVEALSMADIQACITRMLLGEFVANYVIPPQTNIARNLKLYEQLNQDVLGSIDALKKEMGGHYKFHKQDLIECIQGAFRGPESIGYGMPMVVLAVTGTGQIQKVLEKKLTQDPPSIAIKGVNPVPAINKYLNIKISPDRMKANLVDFNEIIYSNSTFKFDRAWFEAQLRISGVVFGLQDDIWSKIEEAWSLRKNLDGMLVAEGQLASPGIEPFLHLNYKDAPTQDLSGKVVNLREVQQRTLVNSGQLVAEVRFKTPVSIGRTVTGQPINPPRPHFEVKLGEGIMQKDQGLFYATCDGLPVYAEQELSVSKVYVHQGDVDLKSGNIRFDGPVEIKGSIDTGATVDVKGPLIVHGMIRGAVVKSRESIEVKEGIVTSDTGFVQAKGNITADFIENSRIQSGGSIFAVKAILNSHVFAVKSISVASNDGIIGGGLVSCRDALVANNIGFPSGAQTILILGTEVRSLQRVTLRMGRIEKLKEAAERYKSELREISGKRDAQMTAKLKTRKEKIQQMMQKVKLVEEKAQMYLNVSQGQVSYNQNALLVCYKKLAANCSIEIAGQSVSINADMLSVAVSAKKRKDSHLCTAEEVAQELERLLPHSGSSTDKKAS
ncbi:MAG: FapA family protein [Proteobacteria bacterium]|nr:FapA family protein [Pseudomonadota bacterium]